MRPQLNRKHFSVYFAAVLLCCVCAEEEKKTVKARERTNVTLLSGGRPNNGHTVWTFGPEKPTMRIATVKNKEVKSNYDERFNHRLQLDSQTGDLTITQLTASDSGVYMWQSIGRNVSTKLFNLIVYGSVISPSITFNKSCTSVRVECSVDNRRELVLSWYRGVKRLKRTSNPDLSSRLYLTLQIESPPEDNYSCVAENLFENRTTKLHREDISLPNGETSCWCQTEATVRLVISAVVGMALIVLVVDHIGLKR